MTGLIFIYGAPASGKSTLGKGLAAALNMPFIDVDAEIQNQSAKSIPTIFQDLGESGFRQIEKAVLLKIITNTSSIAQAVVALGGGALLDAENMERVTQVGKILCLKVDAEILLSRVRKQTSERPLLQGDAEQNLRLLLEKRAAHYAAFPDQLDTSKLSPQQAVWEAQIKLGVFRVTGMGDAYDVHVSPGGLTDIGKLLKERKINTSPGKIALVSDETVGTLYAHQVVKSLTQSGYIVHDLRIPVGESHKTLQTVSLLWESFVKSKLERKSIIIAMGGGVTGDLTGFAAATFLRGLPWVVIPTSLLAMVDSSLGGKTGFDLPQGKNLVGAFYPPRLVLADPQTLETLPAAEQINGLAEVVKHGVVGDPELFEYCSSLILGKDAKGEKLSGIVRRAMAVKLRIIQADPYEKGLREVLNFGHTIGHALEKLSQYRISHGQAVSIGMVTEARLAEHIKLAEKGLAQKISLVLENLGLPVEIPARFPWDSIIEAMQVDKKRSQGMIHFALPVSIGEMRTGIEIPDILTIKI